MKKIRNQAILLYHIKINNKIVYQNLKIIKIKSESL